MRLLTALVDGDISGYRLHLGYPQLTLHCPYLTISTRMQTVFPVSSFCDLQSLCPLGTIHGTSLRGHQEDEEISSAGIQSLLSTATERTTHPGHFQVVLYSHRKKYIFCFQDSFYWTINWINSKSSNLPSSQAHKYKFQLLPQFSNVCLLLPQGASAHRTTESLPVCNNKIYATSSFNEHPASFSERSWNRITI